jgi:hypothetical protein
MGSEMTHGPAGSDFQRRGGTISDSTVERRQPAVNEIAKASETGADDLGALALFSSEAASSTETAAVGREPHVSRPPEDPVRSLRTKLAADSRLHSSRLVLSRMRALRLAVADYASTVRSLLASRSREYLVRHPKLPAQAGLIVCILVAAVMVGHYVGRIDVVPSQAPSPARVASEPLTGGPPVVPTPTPPPAVQLAPPTVPRQAVDRPRDVRSAQMPPAAKAQTPRPQRSTVNIDDSSNSRSRRVENPRPQEIRRETSTARRTAAAETVTASPPSVSVAVPVVPPSARPTVTPSPLAPPVQTAIADESSSPIYSARDVDVRPPQMIEAELPRPAVLNWPTIKNSMELIVTEGGSVQRVKLLTSGERMPDVMLLSRAKLWKFSPALRDGQPVRYRLILTWEVNP